MTEPPTYIHGTDPDEQSRLARLQSLLNAGSLRELALAGGEAVLEVGCGLGHFAREMALAASRVVGFDASEAQLAVARGLTADGAPIDLRHGGAEAPPLEDHEWASFDVAHARFLLEHVPDPLAVVRRMVAAVRPGGRVVLEDDDHDLLRLWPEPPGFVLLWGAYVDAYRQRGHDPFVGRRLTTLLHEAGAPPVRNATVSFSGCAGHGDFELLVRNFVGLLEGAEDAMIATGRIDRARFGVALDAFERWSRRPDASLWYSVCWAEGRRPPLSAERA